MSEVAAALTFGSTVVSGVFSAHVFKQYIDRRRAHQLVWGVGLLMFSLAALCEFLSEVLGWSDGLYRFYYTLAPSLVAVLGLGSLFLLADKRLGKVFAAYTVILFVAFIYFTATTPVNAAAFQPDTIVSGNGWQAGSPPRLFSPLFTIPGSVFLIGIAAYSYWKGRAWFNVFIGVGALIVAAGGSLARFNIPAIMYVSEFAGIALMYVGFVKSVELISRRQAKAAAAVAPLIGETKE